MDMYIVTLKQWVRRMFYEPHHIILLSLIFLITALPLVTLGPAIAVTLCLCRCYVEERKVNYVKDFVKYFKKHFLKALLMWIFDLIFIVMLCISVFMALHNNVNIIVRYFYLIFSLLDLIYLVSGIYRYSILINNDLKLSQIIVQGMLLCLNNAITTFMYLCILLILLIVCILTRIGIVLVLPGGTTFLMVLAFKNIILKYNNLEKEVQ